MTFLEVNVPGSAVEINGQNHVATVDYGHVTTALALARSAHSAVGATEREKQLADAVMALCGVLTEIVDALETGRVGVHNYPAEGSHLQ